MRIERAAGFILYRNVAGQREYLVVRHRGGGAWGFPKGRLELGEVPEAAARREVAEEVGITELEQVPGFREVLSYRFRRGGRTVDKRVVLFLARTCEPGEALPGEIDEIAWLSYEQAAARLTHEEQTELLKRAEAVLSSRDAV